MRVYKGVPERTERGGFKVYRDARLLSPTPSQKLWNHSPNGFNWGYGGSGPAQLALAVLLDVTGNKQVALANYQKFKWDIICKLPGGLSFEINELKVREWLQKSGASLS